MNKFAMAIIAGIFVYSLQASTQSAQKIKEHDEVIREQMIEMSRHLSVTCIECHKAENFTDGSKANFQIAKKHMKLVEALKANGFDGKDGPLATCYTCHRGELKPPYKEGMKAVKKAENHDESRPKSGP